MRLTDFFERVVLISRPDRIERRQRRYRHLSSIGVLDGIRWLDAVIGDLATAPVGWTAGPGGWGCHQSHVKALRQAEADGIDSILVLEDDVIFTRHVHTFLPRFMAALPSTWHQVYLGGQHLVEPDRTGHPLVYRPRNVNRTHAYAVQKSGLPAVLSHLTKWRGYRLDRGWHIDSQLGVAHEGIRWQTYCPTWWLAGQDACVSDIGEGMVLPVRWWHLPRHALQLPYILVPAEATLDEADAARLLFPENGHTPEAHRLAFEKSVRNPALLCGWLRHHARQALVFGRLPAWRENRRLPQIERLWPRGAIPFDVDRLAELQDYPFNGLFAHPVGTTSSVESFAESHQQQHTIP